MSVESFEVGHLSVEIDYDDYPPNPREHDDGLLGTCWFAHRRYDLGDDHAGQEFPFGLDDCVSWEEISERIQRAYPGAVVLVVWMYDHSVRRLSTASFYGRAPHAEWDSGKLGVIYALPQRIREVYAVKRVTEKVRERVIADLNAEIAVYDQWINNEIYRYTVTDEEGDIFESLGGYYDLDECIAEAKEFAESALAEAVA